MTTDTVAPCAVWGLLAQVDFVETTA